MDNAYRESWNLPGSANGPARTLLQPEKEDDGEAHDASEQVGKPYRSHGLRLDMELPVHQRFLPIAFAASGVLTASRIGPARQPARPP
jgi:hypothetical protein